MEKKNIVIYVAGQRFSLSTADSEEYVVGIGEKVDNMIKGIQRENPRFNRDTCATLAALDLCDDETKLRQMLEVLREQVKDYLRDSDNLRSENAKLKAQISELKAQLESMAKNTKETAQADATPAPVPEVTSKKHIAFVGKDFKGDKKKKKHNHNHENPFKEKYAAKPEEAADDTPAGELPEDLPFPDEPYQFNIFDSM